MAPGFWIGDEGQVFEPLVVGVVPRGQVRGQGRLLGGARVTAEPDDPRQPDQQVLTLPTSHHSGASGDRRPQLMIFTPQFSFCIIFLMESIFFMKFTHKPVPSICFLYTHNISSEYFVFPKSTSPNILLVVLLVEGVGASGRRWCARWPGWSDPQPTIWLCGAPHHYNWSSGATFLSLFLSEVTLCQPLLVIYSFTVFTLPLFVQSSENR